MGGLEIALGVIVVMVVLALMKNQDNDELGKETFQTPTQQAIVHGGSNLGLFLGLVVLVIIVVMGVTAGGG